MNGSVHMFLHGVVLNEWICAYVPNDSLHRLTSHVCFGTDSVIALSTPVGTPSAVMQECPFAHVLGLQTWFCTLHMHS